MHTHIRKPEPVEARKFNRQTAENVAKWCGGDINEDVKPSDPSDIRVILRVPNLQAQNGFIVANVGDYVAKTESGRFIVYKGDDFEREYQPRQGGAVRGSISVDNRMSDAHPQGILSPAFDRNLGGALGDVR